MRVMMMVVVMMEVMRMPIRIIERIPIPRIVRWVPPTIT
jgi:hypothetical protein